MFKKYRSGFLRASLANLILKPNRGPSGWANSFEKCIDEGSVLDVLQGIASNGDLPLLNCAVVRTYGISLFKFQNLQGFHILDAQLEVSLVQWTIMNCPIKQDLPATLWSMLFSSQDLEELTLDGSCFIGLGPVFSIEPWNCKSVFFGRWPHLRKLALSNGLIDRDSSSDDEMISTFFQAHPSLEHMSFSGWQSYSSKVIMECLLSLPKLEIYRGEWQQLYGNSLSPRIRSLNLSGWLDSSNNIGNILEDLHHLESLSMRADVLNSFESLLNWLST
ncbi:hypothetical protein BDP27DRAFT_1368340 [Rhodocollybia butyracea]|uniref:Uncharacterized protein n=1 Tax=Rhodocollybia butyracea TaxID=206335 RepID=A0A9P5U0Y4_9AGAR|nr:hypothetical protein BDP27DRAFT_1368340 [Rhodocollybia butyracea]